MKGEKFFSLVGCVGTHGADPYSTGIEGRCFVIPIYADLDGRYFLQNLKFEKQYLPDNVEVWKFDTPTVFPEITRKADVLHGYLFDCSIFIAPYRPFLVKLREIRKKMNFHDPQGIALDGFMSDMKREIFAFNPTLSLMEFPIEPLE